jgi:hypothetical protein
MTDASKAGEVQSILENDANDEVLQMWEGIDALFTEDASISWAKEEKYFPTQPRVVIKRATEEERRMRLQALGALWKRWQHDDTDLTQTVKIMSVRQVMLINSINAFTEDSSVGKRFKPEVIHKLQEWANIIHEKEATTIAAWCMHMWTKSDPNQR